MFTEDLEMLKQENVSGDIALRFFDHDGQECNTTLKERMISISMEQFKKIDRKISLVSGVSKCCVKRFKGRAGGCADPRLQSC